MPVVPDAYVQYGPRVERRGVVGVRHGQVEVHPQIGALVPEGEDLVRYADGSRLQLGLQVLVVGLVLQVLQVHPCQRQEGHERAIGGVEAAEAAATLGQVLDRNPPAHRAVVVEVDELGHQAAEMVFQDLPRLYERVLVDVRLPSETVVVPLGRDHPGGVQHIRPERRLDVGHLFTRQLELASNDRSRGILVAAPVADVSLPRIVLEIEVGIRTGHRVEPSQRLEESRLAGLVLPNQTRDVVYRHPAGVVYAPIVGNPRPT